MTSEQMQAVAEDVGRVVASLVDSATLVEEQCRRIGREDWVCVDCPIHLMDANMGILSADVKRVVMDRLRREVG